MEEEPEKNPYENLGKRQNPYEIYKQRKALAEQTNYKGRFWSGDWLPEGYKNVSMQRSSENPNLVYWKPQEIAMHRSLMPPAVFDTTKERQGFWDNPQTVGRFYDFLSVQDDDYVPPDWLDPDNVKALYKELKAFNENEDWFDWKPLPFGSMGSYTAYHMGSPTGESNYPFRTKTDTLYTERLPTVFGNVQNAIDEYNAIQQSVQTKGYLEQKDYESLKNAIQQYNMPLEEIAEIDPELYQELGGTMEMPQFQTMQTPETKQPDIGEMDWSLFPGWMQFMLTLTTTAEYKNRPESSKKIAAAIPAGVQGFMTASMAGMLTGFIASRVTSPIIATPKVKIGLQLGTFALGTVVGVSQYMKAMSGDTSASGIDKVLQLMGIIDEATERVQGMRDILARDISGREEFVSSQPEYGQTYEEWMAKIREELEQGGEPNPDFGKPGYFSAAWKAAQLYYDAGGINTGDWVTDKVSQAGFFLQQIFPEANISEGLTTKDGQIWRLNEGLDTPQNTEYWGTKTLNLVQQDIMALGKNPDKDKVALVLAKWQDRYGYSGSMNNLAGQILISPTNLVPILSDIGIEKIANVKLKTAIKNNDFVGQVKWTQVKAAAKWAQGNVVTDMLPMVVQQAFEGSMKLIGTNTALNKLLKIASPESNPIGAFWKGSGTPFHVYSAFKSMEASGYSVGAMQDIAELATSAKIISADGTEIKGKIIEGSDTTYKIMDTTNNWVYELDNTDIVKSITDAEGKAIDVPEGMKAVVDKALYQKAVDFMTKDIIETNSKNLTTMLETKPDAVGGKLGEMTTKLADLTPEAKVSKTARSLAEVILNMNAFSGNNADTFNAMIRYYGGDIDIPKISEAAKQFGLGGLIAETTMAWKEFANSPDYSARVSLWKEQVEGRVAVNKIAKGINVEAKDMLVMKPADIYAELLKVNPVVAAGTSPDKIEKLLKPFIKGAPLNDAQYISQMTIAVIEATEKFLIKNYDVKEYPALRRFSNLMKTALGSVVITANIPALITNIGTNEVTAALMLGASGWMTPTKQKAFFERIGMPEATKALIGEGFSMSADIRKAQSQLYRALNPKNSWMTKTQNKISEMSKKIPLIGNLYSVVEDYSRAKAFAGAVKQAMSLPLSEMTPMLRDSLKANGFSNQEIDFLKVASQRAYNPDELEKLFYAGVEFHAIVEDSIKDAFIRVGGDDPVNQKLLEDLFERTELGDYMREVLPKAKTPADLELIRDEFHGKWQDAIDTMMRGSLEAKISDITNSEEGVIGLLSTMSELGIYQYQTQYDMSLKWGEAHARMDSVTDPNLKSQIYNATRALQQRVWDRTWAYLANSYDAIIKKAGVGEYADRFTILVKQEADAAKNYFDNLQKINDDYYDKPKSNESDAAKDAAIADLTKVWRDSVKGMNEQRQKLWIEMLAENVKTVNGLEGDALVRSAQEFSDKHLERLNKLRDAVDKHYDTIKTKNRRVRRTMSEEFFTEKYQPLVAEIRNEFIKDSYKKFFKVGNEPPGTAEPANVVKDIPTNPLDDIIEETTAVTSRNEMSVEAKKQHLITINKAEGIMAKQNVIEGLKLTNATDEQINSYVPILEAAADMYHEITGNDANEWYSKEFDSFEFIDADAIANGEGAASIRFKEDGRAVIQFCKASNLTSAAHEIKHIFLKQLGDYYRAGQSNDFEVVAKELGGISGQEFLTIVDSVIKGDYTPEQWKQWDDISEKFVDGLTKFELDDSPSLLRGAFVKFSRFIAKLFEEAGKYFNDIISPEMYEVYTRLYSKNDSAQRIARNKGRINESPTGIKVVVKDSDMHPYELIPVIVDMDWITKSHTLTGSETPGYNKSLQPREYKLDNVEKYARELNPDAVIDKAVTFSNGMPVINEDGMVIVGNHRMGALERARVSYPDNWKAYQDYLVKSLEQYGFDADDLKGIENPVLVYKPADPNQVDVIVNAANISDQQMMTDFANAIKFAKFIKPESMAKLEVQEGQSFKDAIYSKSGDGIRTDFASNIASSESAAYIDAKGNLTENGLQTIMNAIASKAFGDKPEGKLLLVNAIESKNTVAQNVMTAMVEAVPGIAKLNALIEQGVLPEGYAISETLAKAVNEYIAFKNQPKGDAIAQTDLFNVRTPLTIDLMTFFDNFGKSKKVIGELITRYIDSAIKQGSVNPDQLSLLDDGAKNVLPADELMKSMLDLVNGKATKELEAVKDARHVAVIKDITTKPIDKWDANVRASVEQQLQAFQAEIKVSRTEPPAWMNVKDLYEGTSKSYSEVRKAIKNILDGKTPTTQKELAVLRQAFNRAIAESKAFEKYVGAQNTDYGLNAKMDKLLQDISEVTQMSFIPGQERVMEVVKELENIKPEVDKYDPTNPIRVKFKEGWRIAQQQALPLSDFEVEQMVVAEKLAKVKNTPQQGTLFQDKLIDSVKEGQPLFQAITEVPVGGDQITRQDWSGWNELANHKLEPLFNQIMDNYVGHLGEPQMKLKFDNLDDAGKAAMRAQYERWKTDIQLRTAAAVDYGKAMTDHTLLDYTQKRGVDNLLQAVFPFQFWYTQSISEWGKHMISTPVIGATYSKYKEMMRRNKLSGLPSRLAGKSPLYAPWLPDELGDTLWVNPMSKFFPLESLTQPVANLSDLSYEITNNAIRKVNDMVRRGLITKEQALQAIDDKDGVIWQNAVSTARLESGDKLDPMSMVSMMMQPAPWYTMPYYMIQGTPEKNYPYPPTRLGLALAAQSDGLLGAFGKMIAYPETKIREIAGLSPHGEFGDYYIEFMLANMATGDKYDTDTIIRAMLEKEGEAYEEAKQLSDEYLSYRMPGSALIQAVKYAKETGEYGYIAPAFLATMFPAGLFPKGELEQRGLAKQYSEAWDKFVLGDTEAMQTFFDENPEYEARLALFKDEPERLHSHLINILWDSYMKLSSPDKKLVNDQLGQSFKTYFLDTNTRDYSRLDNDMLAYWGRRLNAKVPATPETESALNRTMNPLEMYKPDIAAAAQDFMNMRNEMFPNFYWLQNLYFEIPESDRQKFLKGFPELKEYWDWKDSYTEANPLVADYLEDQKSRYTGSDATQFEEPNMKLFAEWDAELALAVGLYMISGQSLSTGAKAELTRIWDGLGRPGGSFDVWLKAYLGL